MPPKPFLRKRGGVTGRLMKKIHYPTRRGGNVRGSQRASSSEEHSNSTNFSNDSRDPGSDNGQRVGGSSRTSSSASEHIDVPLQNQEEAQDTRRPYTAGTADSGYPEDTGSVVLSPNSQEKEGGLESVVVDVTDRSNDNSVASSEVRSTHGAPSVIPDVSSFSTDEPEVVSAVPKRFYHEKRAVQKVPADTSVGNSTAEFERIESHVHALTSSGTSENSQGTDGTRSRHWRQVIKEFATEANKKPEVIRLESVSARRGSSSAGSSSRTSERISNETIIADFINLHKKSRKEASKKLRAMRETFPSIFSEKESGIYAQVKKVGNNAQQKETVLLEKSLEDLNIENVPQKKVPERPKSSIEERNLAKQLRDLIAHIDVANENRHYEYQRFEAIFDEALQEKEYFHQQVNELKKRIVQLEEEEQVRKENQARTEEIEKLRCSDLDRLRKENAILNRKQKQKDGGDSEIVNLLKEQIGDLRGMLRDLERQRTEMRAQVRKSNLNVKEKNDIIEQLKEEKARLEKRIAVIANNKAALRGRQAENALSAQAIERASKSAAVTTATKVLTPQNNDFLVRNVAPSGRNVNQMGSAPRRQNAVTFVDNTDTFSDNGDIAIVDQGMTHPHLGKNVRWNEPLATTASFSPPLSAQSSLNIANPDMHLILTENNLIGRASLYRGENDFAVYTVTHCGCHFYEYSNTDTRWIHPSKRYQVNYYGQAGATTVEIDAPKLLIRHFLSGQLEIYRESGETTLVTPDGHRTEVIRDRLGAVRVEIYELDGRVRVKGRGELETVHRATQTSCHRTDGSYVSYVASDDSLEWRAPDYVVHRFKNGDTKVRLNLIDTSITMLVMDVGTVKHLSNPVSRRLPKYCAEWGTVARKRSRVIAATQSRVLNQL